MAKRGKNVLSIRVIIFRDTECDAWVAQGLELDICAQAATIDAVHLAFHTALLSTLNLYQEEGRNPLAEIGKAPRHFFELYDRSMVRTEFDRAEPSTTGARRDSWYPNPIYKVTEALAAAA